MPEYEYTTMYEPRTGSPVSVPSGEVQARLNEGFRTQMPGEDTLLKPMDYILRDDISPSATVASREMEAIEINTSSLKALSVRLGLSTPQSKIVKDRVPYKNLEDLIAKVPEINNWANLAHLISFEVQEAPSEKEEEQKEGVNIETEAKFIDEKEGLAPVSTNEDLTPSGTSKKTSK